VVTRPTDEVLGVPSYFSLGFLRPGPQVSFGSSPRAVGAPGAGGSFAFADPDAHLGYAYVMNKLDFYLANDPREKSLRDAVYRAIARLSGPKRAMHLSASEHYRMGHFAGERPPRAMRGSSRDSASPAEASTARPVYGQVPSAVPTARARCSGTGVAEPSWNGTSRESTRDHQSFI
jgi:hypothetical protein